MLRRTGSNPVRSTKKLNMATFNVGDKVICRDNLDQEDILTIEEVYEVLAVDGNYICISGCAQYFTISRFRHLRGERIKNLLKEL
jgi:hypothetical protein